MSSLHHKWCAVCKGMTVHMDGKCLICEKGEKK